MSGRYRLHHIAIQTRGMEKAIHFYRDLLGLKIIKEETSPKGRRVVWFDAGEIRIELYSAKAGQRLSEAWSRDALGPLSIGLLVDDLNTAAADLKRQGVSIHREPYYPVPGERAAMIVGPDGEEIVLLERRVEEK